MVYQTRLTYIFFIKIYISHWCSDDVPQECVIVCKQVEGEKKNIIQSVF